MVAAHYKKDDLLNCGTSSSDISGYHTDFHEGHGTIGAWQGRSIGTACYVWIGLKAPPDQSPQAGYCTGATVCHGRTDRRSTAL